MTANPRLRPSLRWLVLVPVVAAGLTVTAGAVGAQAATKPAKPHSSPSPSPSPSPSTAPPATTSPTPSPSATASATASSSPTASATPTATTTTAAPALLSPAQAAALHVVSYYPANAGWSSMWTSFDPTRIDADFATIASLGANGVRIITFPTTFGYPTPSSTMQAELAQVVSLAGSHHLRVALTLFDWWNAYTDVAGSKQWASALLSPYAGDPRIGLVELKNEIPTTDSTAMAWAAQMLPYLHTVLPATPTTLSVSGTEGTAGLQRLVGALGSSQPDVYDLHYYGGGSEADSAFAAAKAIAGTRPLRIGEGGQSTASTDPAEAEADADKWWRQVDAAAAAQGLAPVDPWTLNDFAPGAIPPSGTANDPKEYAFGLVRLDGTHKPDFATVAAAFQGLPMSSDLNGGFEALGTTGTMPVTWSTFCPGTATYLADRTAPHSGLVSMSIGSTAGTTTCVPSVYTTPVSPVRGGQSWTATAYVRGTALTGSTRLALSWFDANGTWLGQAESASLPTGTTTWRQLAVTAAAPAGAAQLQLHLKSSANTGVASFDDVTLTTP